MRKKIVLILTAVCLALSMLVLVACNDEVPENKEGVLYQSEVESFWIGIGKAYMTLEHNTEPETPEEGKLYGNVFNVTVSADGGKTYSSWLSGTWKIENGTLTLNATWQEGDNATMLDGGTSGQDVTYSEQDGKYVVGVVMPSAGTIEFELYAA